MIAAGLDEIDWSSLTHAYGPASDIPQWIRELRSDDPERVGAALDALGGSLRHQGTVYPATVAAVPFLIDAARQALHGRADQIAAIGMLADPHHAYGPDFSDVRTAVVNHASRLVVLLDDDDDEVRCSVVYLAAQTGALPADDLLDVWDEAEEPWLRVAVLFALAAADPDGAASWPDLIDWEDEEPEVVLAAALALQRAGRPWPDEAIDALVEAFEAEADLPYEWHADDEPTTEVVLNAAEDVRDALLSRMLQADEAARGTALWILAQLFQSSRGARERFAPRIGPLLADPDARHAAVDLLRQTGSAAGRYRDELAAIAAGYPAVATSQGFTTELYALQALTRLGDARWVAIAGEGARAGGRHHLDCRKAPLNPETLAAVRTRLGALPAEGVTEADEAEMAVLHSAYAQWGESALDLVPRLRELAAAYGSEVARFLVAVGDRSAPVLGRLRVSAVDGAISDAVSLWQASGDPTLVVAAVRRQLATEVGIASIGEAIPAGAELGELADALRVTAERETLGLDIRLMAARLLWSATGETGPAVELALQSLGDWSSGPPALELIRLLDARHLADDVRKLLDDDNERLVVAGARTLVHFGTPPADILPHLYRCLSEDWFVPAVEALDLIVELARPDSAPVLLELANRDAAVVTAGVEPDIVWNDEELAARLRSAADQLAAMR